MSATTLNDPKSPTKVAPHNRRAADLPLLDTIIVAVKHRGFNELPPKAIHAFGNPVSVLYDITQNIRKSGSGLRP